MGIEAPIEVRGVFPKIEEVVQDSMKDREEEAIQGLLKRCSRLLKGYSRATQAPLKAIQGLLKRWFKQ